MSKKFTNPVFIFLISILLLITWVNNLNGSVKNKSHKPNFILINIDDLGYSETEPYGSKVNLTPK
jgi:hypothetical protein